MRYFLFSIALLGTSAWAFDTPKPAKPVKPVFEMSKETTVILEPLDKDGYPDYETALNLRLRGTIKPEDNACVKLWQALGPKTESGKPIPASYWEWLECKAPPEKGDYFIPLLDFFKSEGKREISDEEYEVEVRITSEPWSEKDHPDFAKWLKLNETPLNVAIDAVGRKSFFSPFVHAEEKKGNIYAALLPSIQKCRGIGDCLVKRAMLRTNYNQFDDAWKDLQACHRLARHVANGATYLDLLVGNALEMLACRADVAFLERANPKGEKLVHYRNDLESMAPLPKAFEKLELGEYYSALDMVGGFRHGGVNTMEFIIALNGMKMNPPLQNNIFDRINWPDTFRTINQWHDRQLKLMRIADRPTRMKAWKDFDKEYNSLKAEIEASIAKWNELDGQNHIDNNMGKTIGKLVIVVVAPACLRIEQSCERGLQTLSLTQLAFALAAYREAKGSYPDKLDQLVPTYVKTVPVDLFSGKAPIYRKTEKGYIVYSVGLNEKDDGGNLISDERTDDEPRGDDIGVRMPAKQ